MHPSGPPRTVLPAESAAVEQGLREALAAPENDELLRMYESVIEEFQLKIISKRKDYQSFAEEVRNREPGVYVVGLDTHVAFIVVVGRDFRFIHSSGSRPWCVVDERPAEAGVLQRSNWRMLGNLTGDASVLRRWLKAEKIVVRGT